MKKTNIFLIALLVVLVTLSACSSEENVETQKEMQQEDSSASLPENIPKNIPIYTNSELTNVRVSEDERAEFISLSLAAKGSVADVNGWYYKAMQENGWTIKSDKTVVGYRIIQAEHIEDNLFTSMQATGGAGQNTSIISQQIQIRK